MNKAKKLVMILIVLAALLVPVMATQTMSVSWKWSHEDLDVAYYRYQLNGESEEGWTVVSNSVLSYEASDLDPYSSYSLYLQCSYDGENWSESAVAVAEPLLVAEPEPVEEETPAIVEPLPVEEEPQAEDIAVAPVEESAVTAPVKEKPEYGYKTNLLITAGAGTNVTFDKFALDGAFPRFGVALEFQNIVHAGPWGIGLRVDVNSILSPEMQDWNKFDIKNLNIWYDSSADAKLMMYLGNNSFDFYFGGGAGYSIFNPHFTEEADQEMFGHSLGNLGIFSTAWYGSGNVGMRFRITDVFSLGLEANYRFLMPAKKHTASADLVFGFTF